MKRKFLTLCIIHQNNKVLLGMKKRGFGVGRWNGFGGKVNDGEQIIDAAIRETQEEVGITPNELQEIGIVDFEFQNDIGSILEVHIFKSTSFSGVMGESEEMKPKWFEINKIPFAKMWKDDKYWFPLFLQNRKFKAKFLFDANDCIVEHTLREVESLR